jgi:transposase
VEYGFNRNKEKKLAQINLALLSGSQSGIPSYYEILPGSLNDVKTIKGFTHRMKKYKAERIKMLLDRGFYSEANLKCLLSGSLGFYIPVPANIKFAQNLIDEKRDDIEMPENIITFSKDRKDALYGMSVKGKLDGKRIYQHIYFDTARRTEYILDFFADLDTFEQELISGDTKEANSFAYAQYFTVKRTPKRGLKVTRNKEAIDAYKSDRAGYWVIISNCEKDAKKALQAYRARSRVESAFDDLKNELDMKRIRTHNKDTMRGRVFVQFLALIITSQIRATLDEAWDKRLETPKDDRLSRRYSLSELMLRLGSYRATRFTGSYGQVVSTPTKAQREIFTAFGIEVKT